MVRAKAKAKPRGGGGFKRGGFRKPKFCRFCQRQDRLHRLQRRAGDDAVDS